MGIKVVDGKLYVSEKHRLTELIDTNGDEVADQSRTVATWPYGGNFHEFAFGLLYEDGFFYLNLSVAINYGGATTDPQPAREPRHHHQGQQGDRQVEYVAGGLRTPQRHRLGPGGRASSSPTTRAAGCPRRSWCTSSRTGSSTTTPTRPARSTTSRSPSRCCGCRRTRSPTRRAPRCCMTQRPLRRADALRRRHLRRPAARLPGEGQRRVPGRGLPATPRASRPASTGSASAPTARSTSAASAPAATGARTASSRYGLQKLTPNGASAFDILTMRAIDGRLRAGVHPAAVGGDRRRRWPAKLQGQAVALRRRPPTYGGPKVDEETADRHRRDAVRRRQEGHAHVAGLKPGRVVHVRSPRPFTSAVGAAAVEHRGLVHAQRAGRRPGDGLAVRGGERGAQRRRQAQHRPPGYSGIRLRRRLLEPRGGHAVRRTRGQGRDVPRGPALLQRPEPLRPAPSR